MVWVGGNRHLVTAPPPPPGGGEPSSLGGMDIEAGQVGGGGRGGLGVCLRPAGWARNLGTPLIIQPQVGALKVAFAFLRFTLFSVTSKVFLGILAGFHSDFCTILLCGFTKVGTGF